MDTLYIILES